MKARRCHGDRGAVLVIVAVFAIVAVVMLAFVVDIGGLREEKKEVTLSTDAAALAIASELDLRTFAPGTYDCGVVPVISGGFASTLATRYRQDNGGTGDDGCRVVVTGPRRGYVLVGGRENVPYAFGPAVGQASGDVRGVSASVARVDSGGGLRPIGLCNVETTINVDGTGQPYSMEDDVLGGARDGTGTLSDPVDMVIAIDHLNRDDECSVGAPGQRGQLNLDPSQAGNGGSNRCTDPDPEPGDADAAYFTSEYRFGYFDSVEQYTPTDSGNDFATLSACFDRDIAEEQLFWLPIFDDYVPPSEGGPTVRILAFAQAQLTGYCLSPPESNSVPPSIGCLADVPGETGPGEKWLRLTISRVVDFDEMGPPLTDDSLRDSPAICAERDDAALLSACVPPNPPPRGTPGNPNPPPRACEISGITPPSATVANTPTGNRLAAAVSFEITLVDFADCPPTLYVRADRGGGPKPEVTVTVASNTVTATFPAGRNGFNEGVYSIRVSSEAAGTPMASPTTPILTVT